MNQRILPSRLPFPRHRTQWLGRTLLLTAALISGACSATASPSPDLASPVDMTVVSDLSSSPSCGKIVTCTVACGLGKLECDTQCAMGANATEAMKAGALALCAVLHCASSDGGTGVSAILGCLLQNCQSEVLACDGLF